MTIAQPITFVDEITDFLAAGPSPEEIIAFQISERLQQRALELLERNRNGELGPDERIEMEMYVRFDNFMTLLKAKACLKSGE